MRFSEHGWISENIMKFVLDIINSITKGEKSALILDEYSVHTTDLVKVEAKKLNIQLIYVPPGKTSTNQPLDVGINGPIKSIGKKISKEIYLADPFKKITLADSVSALIESKNQIKRETVIKSFNLACKI